MDFICAGNWKMNKGPSEASAFIKNICETATPEEQKNLLVFPPALAAQAVADGVKGSALSWGGQNCYLCATGAFTGENSAQVMKDMGAKYCLVGHSERRHIFAEPDDMIAKKVQFLQPLGLTPLLCVGETLDDRRWNRTEEVIVRQIKSALKLADPSLPLWVAYEPVWAIGTGEVATPMQVEEAHGMLRVFLKEWSSAASDRIPILYGGSVKPDNAKTLSALNHVAGFLIGGASLSDSEFLSIARHSKRA